MNNLFIRGELLELRKGGYEVGPTGVRYTFSEPQVDLTVRHGEHIIFEESHNDLYFWGINPTTGERGLMRTTHFKKVRKK